MKEENLRPEMPVPCARGLLFQAGRKVVFGRITDGTEVLDLIEAAGKPPIIPADYHSCFHGPFPADAEEIWHNATYCVGIP